MQTKSITKEGVNISYRVSRLENKPWLVMLHGWGSNHTIWTPYTHYFSDRFSMITPDLRGHGKSKNGHIDFHTLRKDLLAILDEEKVPKAEFLGHSIGATIAADFASHHPNRVSSLALATLSTRRYTFMRPLVQTTVAAILAVHPEGDRLFQSYWTDPHTPVRFTVPLDL